MKTLKFLASKFKILFYSVFFKNRVRYCSVCERKSTRFFTAGQHDKRPDAKCPWCGSVERHRFIWSLLQRKTDLFSNKKLRVLHIAPETHFESRLHQQNNLEYITGDLNPEAAQQVIDITNIQFPENYFDAILCSHVLEHVPDDRKAMREFYRVLKPDRWALLAVPITVEKTVEDPYINDPDEQLRLFGQEDHVRRYGLDYFERLKDAGFDLETFDTSFFSDNEVNQMRLMKSEIVPICYKRNIKVDSKS